MKKLDFLKHWIRREFANLSVSRCQGENPKVNLWIWVKVNWEWGFGVDLDMLSQLKEFIFKVLKIVFKEVMIPKI